MQVTNKKSLMASGIDMRIVGLNTNKTRKTYGSDTVYEVYFELSGTSSLAWKDIFKREWKITNSTHEVNIDKEFLLMHCPLKEIVTRLPFLKEAVDVTNKKYRQYIKEQAIEWGRRDDIWKQARKDVEDVAKSLHFD
jgi:hypothetical protein